MTTSEALVEIFGRHHIVAERNCVDYDPGAGSTYEYFPNIKALLPIETLLRRRVVEADLRFSANSYGDYYYLAAQTVSQMVAALELTPWNTPVA